MSFIKMKTKLSNFDEDIEENDTLIFVKHIVSIVQRNDICEITLKRGKLYSTTNIRDIEKSIKLSVGGTGHTVMI